MDNNFDDQSAEVLQNALIGLHRDRQRYLDKQETRFWQEIELPLTLEKALARLTKSELDKIRQTWQFSGLSALKKDELAAQLCRRIPQTLAGALRVMDNECYHLIQKICANGGVIFVDEFGLDQAEYWRKYGLIFSGSYREQKVLCIPDEVAVVFRSVDDPELRRIVERNTEWVKLTQGMLFYYGVLSVTQIRSMLGKLCSQEPDYMELFNVLIEASLHYRRIHYNSRGFADSRVFDAEKVREEQKARPSIEYFQFSKGQLLKAAAPGYIDRTPAHKCLTDLLTANFDIPRAEAERLVGECAIIVNLTERPTEVVEFLTAHFEPPAFNVLQQIIDALMELMNTTRQWILKGHKPSEIFQEERKHLQPLPAKPFDFEPSNVIDMRTRTRVGRNDPCPCGSGKKFKRCCGKA